MKKLFALILAGATITISGFALTQSVSAATRSGLNVVVYQYPASYSGAQWIREFPWTKRWQSGKICLATTFRQINHDWGNGAILRSCPDNDFLVRYSGKIRVPATGEYTFYSSTDDGFRLQIGSTVVIEDWELQAMTDFNGSGSIVLTAGQWYSLEAWMFENDGGAGAELHYSFGSSPAIVPTEWYRTR